MVEFKFCIEWLNLDSVNEGFSIKKSFEEISYFFIKSEIIISESNLTISTFWEWRLVENNENNITNDILNLNYSHSIVAGGFELIS